MRRQCSAALTSGHRHELVERHAVQAPTAARQTPAAIADVTSAGRSPHRRPEAQLLEWRRAWASILALSGAPIA